MLVSWHDVEIFIIMIIFCNDYELISSTKSSETERRIINHRVSQCSASRHADCQFDGRRDFAHFFDVIRLGNSFRRYRSILINDMLRRLAAVSDRSHLVCGI